MSPLNPWLERALVSLAAGVATTGALVATAEKPGKKKKKKKKTADGKDAAADDVRATPHVDAPGDAAVREAKKLDQRGMSVEELGASLKGVGSKLAAVFTRKKAADSGASSEALSPDEVRTKDGVRVDARGVTGKKRTGKHAKGRRRKRRPQASLWDSAKESMRQTVKEAVHEEVKDTPVGSAMETLKKAGTSIREGAAAAVGAVKAAIPDDAGARIARGMDEAGRSLGELTKNADQVGKRIEEGVHKAADTLDAGARDLVEQPPEVPPSAAEVAEKLNKGVDVVGAWLKGPGGGPPQKNGTGRVRPAAGGDVVEAKDPDAPIPPPSPDSGEPKDPA